MNNFKYRFTIGELIEKLEIKYPSVSGGVYSIQSRPRNRVINSVTIGEDIFKKVKKINKESIIASRESREISDIKLKKTYNCDAFKTFDISTIYNINKIGICNEDNYRYNLEDFHKFIQFIENKEKMGE